MDVLSYSRARQKLRRVMEDVCDKRAPLVITRQNARPVVMMSLEEFRAIEETLHLLRSPRNAARLLKSIRSADAGRLKRRAAVDA
jgi:antitoxin YefM